ncbi:hypothetical protein [Streptomyces sp. ISL-1]|uniref:hypothetical protein n=1 Tax=Streptomyces sp. ISL-1 TaxID=2817657 RepID=UPI002556F896|nr:hypothetical protein [Streptomyces sp. ISL-1]
MRPKRDGARGSDASVHEDEERVRRGARNGLEAEGFAVDGALDGTDGLWRARETAYDAIVLDIMLPAATRRGRHHLPSGG